MKSKPFSVSAKILIQDEKGRWLLLKRSPNSKWNPGKWELPGGKINKNENLEESLEREVLEETGLTVSVNSFYDTIEDETSSNRIVHVIMAGSVQTGSVCLSREHAEFEWAEPSAMASLDLCDYARELLEKSDTVGGKKREESVRKAAVQNIAPGNIDIQWLKNQVKEFTRVHSRYKELAILLETILKTAANEIAPYSMVQTRERESQASRKKRSGKEPSSTIPCVNSQTCAERG